ncbi:MAG: triose-phosphate isomerase, partial [bacterium]|nr:triose-phosphate isomerase [bacterium]
CPPFVFLDDVSKILKNSRLSGQAELGAQDIALADSGAWTGEVSGPMLKRFGVKYVIVGHSERRWKINESNEVVNKKLKTILANDLTPIVCVGEKVRDENFKEFLKEQVSATFKGLSADEIGKCLIAYEPVWAISSNPDSRPDTPESALESIAVVRDCLTKSYSLITNPLFLYGGSVTYTNVKSFLSLEQISGVLVGGASVRKEEFVQILKNL